MMAVDKAREVVAALITDDLIRGFVYWGSMASWRVDAMGIRHLVEPISDMHRSPHFDSTHPLLELFRNLKSDSDYRQAVLTEAQCKVWDAAEVECVLLDP